MWVSLFCLKHISQGSKNASINVMEWCVKVPESQQQTNEWVHKGEQATHFAYCFRCKYHSEVENHAKGVVKASSL